MGIVYPRALMARCEAESERMRPIDMLAAEYLDRQKYTSDRIAGLHGRVKRLQRLVAAYDDLQYSDPFDIVNADDNAEKQSAYELARQDCEKHGDLEGDA